MAEVWWKWKKMYSETMNLVKRGSRFLIVV